MLRQGDFSYNIIIVLEHSRHSVEQVTKLRRTPASHSKIDFAAVAYALDRSQFALQIGPVQDPTYDVTFRIIGLHHARLICEDKGTSRNLGLDASAKISKVPCFAITPKSGVCRGYDQKEQRAG